jgi:hypothetical protein
MRRRTPRLLLVAGTAALLLAAVRPVADAASSGLPGVLAPVTAGAARAAEPVVLTGADLPTWSRLAATGTPAPYPSGTSEGQRDAHNGTVVVPPDPRDHGVPVDQIAAYRWDGRRFQEIPVQVDERMPYFLANGNSDFGVYSGTDQELTYVWDVEAWRRTAGECSAAYADGVGATPDPVPGLDDDDEIALMASDAGVRAPAAAPGPRGSGASRQVVALADPATGAPAGYVYLFLQPGGSSFDASNGYVRFTRAPDADQWIDKDSFAEVDPEKLGTSNRGYGPNLAGTVCNPDGTVRQSTDRFPRDGHVVTTRSYRMVASGRWMLREVHVADPSGDGTFGPDLVDRWKGRAFQQSPDSTVSLVGFEDEQVNWEANSALLGWRAGAVRALREVWGADSGTNVTKLETYYRDAIAYRYRVRVHPIPPDGLYTSWDYNRDVASTYYNALHPEGVPIDGVNDDVGQVDQLPTGDPAFFDFPDPTFDVPLAFDTWEQVSGRGRSGSLVYVFELTGPTSLANPAVVPYYRDDACLDDGTGDDPVARPFPGEATDDPRVQAGYATRAGRPYAELTCADKQGAYGSHGIHFFATGDSDNLFVGSPAPLTEIDGQQWQFAVPTERPTNVGEPYANIVRAKLRVVAVEQASTPAAGQPRGGVHTKDHGGGHGGGRKGVVGGGGH